MLPDFHMFYSSRPTVSENDCLEALDCKRHEAMATLGDGGRTGQTVYVRRKTEKLRRALR